MIYKFCWEKIEENHKHDEEFDGDNEYDDGYDDDKKIGIPMQIPFQAFIPSININSNDFLAKKFDLWILHTNFDITGEIIDLVSEIAGVEVLDVLTRYRLRIGFHKVDTTPLFNVEQIKQDIEDEIINFFTAEQDELLNNFTDSLLVNKIKEFRNYLMNKYEHWALLVLPNGSMEIVSNDKYDSKFCDKVKLFSTLQSTVGGIVLISSNHI